MMQKSSDKFIKANFLRKKRKRKKIYKKLKKSLTQLNSYDKIVNVLGRRQEQKTAWMAE